MFHSITHRQYMLRRKLINHNDQVDNLIQQDKEHTILTLLIDEHTILTLYM